MGVVDWTPLEMMNGETSSKKGFVEEKKLEEVSKLSSTCSTVSSYSVNKLLRISFSVSKISRCSSSVTRILCGEFSKCDGFCFTGNMLCLAGRISTISSTGGGDFGVGGGGGLSLGRSTDVVLLICIFGFVSKEGGGTFGKGGSGKSAGSKDFLSFVVSS